jgi:hypothetical protein
MPRSKFTTRQTETTFIYLTAIPIPISLEALAYYYS